MRRNFKRKIDRLSHKEKERILSCVSCFSSGKRTLPLHPVVDKLGSTCSCLSAVQPAAGSVQVARAWNTTCAIVKQYIWSYKNTLGFILNYF